MLNKNKLMSNEKYDKSNKRRYRNSPHSDRPYNENSKFTQNIVCLLGCITGLLWAYCLYSSVISISYILALSVTFIFNSLLIALFFKKIGSTFARLLTLIIGLLPTGFIALYASHDTMYKVALTIYFIQFIIMTLITFIPFVDWVFKPRIRR